MNAEHGALVPHDADLYRMSTDAAGKCREIVVATASKIQGRQFVSVEGWQAIALAHGLVASAIDVRRVTDEGCEGFSATGLLRRMSDGAEIARAEGFVGDDEKTWGKRDVYARRAMAQTRAISRVCRSAFAHVVVMMKAGLATTPAEEVPHEGFDRETGEVIDVQASSGPAPKTKLDGPHSCKTALKSAVQKLDGELRAATDIAHVNAIWKAGQDTIKQALRDWPELINGDPNVPEIEGLRALAARRRTELTPAEASELFRDLVESLNQCDTEDAMQSLVDMRAGSIADLDGAESRKFTALYDERSAILKSGKVPLVPAETK